MSNKKVSSTIESFPVQGKRFYDLNLIRTLMEWCGISEPRGGLSMTTIHVQELVPVRQFLGQVTQWRKAIAAGKIIPGVLTHQLRVGHRVHDIDVVVRDADPNVPTEFIYLGSRAVRGSDVRPEIRPLPDEDYSGATADDVTAQAERNSTPVTVINGIGPAIAAKLAAAGITSVTDLAHTSPVIIAEVSGKDAETVEGWLAQLDGAPSGEEA